MTEAAPRPIGDVAAGLEIDPRHLVPYGDDKAKVRLEAARESGRPPGKLILVSAITPTLSGEGKTTTSIGLAQGLVHRGHRACLALREPSLGPVFGRKGGATGSGRAALVPADDINLHFTGDFHAVAAANNLLAAMADNSLHHGNPLGLDARRMLWRRVLDVNDRALRHLVIGLGGPGDGVPREGGFDITAASEVMAVLCLAEGEDDLRRRLGRLIVGLTADRRAVTADDVEATGAMMALLKDALLPNLVQTVEGVPALVHGGPFANIAHGCNSVLATRLAMASADWTVTEAGFAFDLGGEKFFDLKCRAAGLDPALVVVVATVKALKRHGEADPDHLGESDPSAVERGLPNLLHHVETVGRFGKRAVVALNHFAGDADEEVDVVRRACESAGIPFAVSRHHAEGGAGAAELAEVVVAAAGESSAPFRPLYPLDASPEEKMEAIARGAYGAGEVVWSAAALRDLDQCRRLGFGDLPLCVAKAPTSLSDDPDLVGRPRGFTVTVRRVVLSAGAGFLVPLLGDVMRMPGLPKRPSALDVDVREGRIVGLR
jgi:formate--tetrahydrofolate ligase